MPPGEKLTDDRLGVGTKLGFAPSSVRRLWKLFLDCQFKDSRHDVDATWRTWCDRSERDIRTGRDKWTTVDIAWQERQRTTPTKTAPEWLELSDAFRASAAHAGCPEDRLEELWERFRKHEHKDPVPPDEWRKRWPVFVRRTLERELEAGRRELSRAGGPADLASLLPGIVQAAGRGS